MSGFFDYCVNCGIMFTDREKFLAHKPPPASSTRSARN